MSEPGDAAGAGAEVDPGTDPWVVHRALLFTVAYELLGSAADAEEVLQETWLRWSGVERSAVRDERAYLVRITSRLALNRIRTLARRRESYVGPWLPEALLTSPDVADDAELAEAVSTAMLLVLETLAPTERVVFVLRDVFDLPYDEIAAAVDKSPAAVRQVAHRARSAVRARRPRGHVTNVQRAAVIERFRRAVDLGDLQTLVDVLSPDVVLLSDGGGVKRAALRPVRGLDKVLRFLIGVMPSEQEVRLEVAEINGAPGILLFVGGELDTVATARLEVGPTGVVATELYLVRNPAKLAAVVSEVRLAR